MFKTWEGSSYYLADYFILFILFIYLFIYYNTITNYILILYELSNFDHAHRVVPQTRVSGGNRNLFYLSQMLTNIRRFMYLFFFISISIPGLILVIFQFFLLHFNCETCLGYVCKLLVLLVCCPKSNKHAAGKIIITINSHVNDLFLFLLVHF